MIKNESIIKWLCGNMENLNKQEEDALMKTCFPDKCKGNTPNYGAIGEELFAEYLTFKGISFTRQSKIGALRIDFETDTSYYEIKTRRYNMSGTAGEKIICVPHKYRNITGTKPLVIVLMAYQEQDDQGVFDSDNRQKDYMELWKKQGFSYVKFSSLIPKPACVAKPVIKWAGGKSKLLNKIVPYIMNMKPKIYVEPFLGGGSVAIELMSRGLDAKYILNDKNTHLINMYECIKNDVETLITLLKTLESKTSKEEYYAIRDTFNKEHDVSIENASRFMYLMKTCFRGLYRVNSKGEFNVPYGNYKRWSFDYENIKNLNTLLNKYDVEFLNTDYTELDIPRDEASFIYMDPPYVNTFDGYTSDGFDYELFDKFINYDYAAMHWIVSNSGEYLSHITELEVLYDIFKVQDRINSKDPSKERTEIIIYNIP